jgi:hypothetical protein
MGAGELGGVPTPHVLIGACLHTPPGSLRAACLPAFVAHLGALDTSGLSVSQAFVLDDVASTAAGAHRLLLSAFGAAALLIVQDDGEAMPEVRRARVPERMCGYARMAYLRNMLRARAIYEGADFLLSVDGDVLPPRGLLQALLRADAPMASGLVCNDPPVPGETPDHYNVMEFTSDGHYAFHVLPDLAHGGPCDVAGAVCLYRRDLLEAARWAPDPQGEDIGLGRLARQAGLRGRYVPVLCEHLMAPPQVDAHRAACGLPACALAYVEAAEGIARRPSNLT